VAERQTYSEAFGMVSDLGSVPVWTEADWHRLNDLHAESPLWNEITSMLAPIMAMLAESATDPIDRAIAARVLWKVLGILDPEQGKAAKS
jgi:hypothetical protein